jgi:hypothetical protein
VSPVRYELGFYIPEGGILRSRRRENLKYYKCIYSVIANWNAVGLTATRSCDRRHY